MNPEFYYITADAPTVKVPLYQQEEISLSHMNLIELIPPPCLKLYCYNNELTELIIPQGCIYVSCYVNKLTKLIIPEGCEEIWCNFNQLTELIVPRSCKKISCWKNNLTRLIVPKSIKYINCSNIHGNTKIPTVIIDLLESKDPVKIQLANHLQRI